MEPQHGNLEDEFLGWFSGSMFIFQGNNHQNLRSVFSTKTIKTQSLVWHFQGQVYILFFSTKIQDPFLFFTNTHPKNQPQARSPNFSRSFLSWLGLPRSPTMLSQDLSRSVAFLTTGSLPVWEKKQFKTALHFLNTEAFPQLGPGGFCNYFGLMWFLFWLWWSFIIYIIVSDAMVIHIQLFIEYIYISLQYAKPLWGYECLYIGFFLTNSPGIYRLVVHESAVGLNRFCLEEFFGRYPFIRCQGNSGSHVAQIFRGNLSLTDPNSKFTAIQGVPLRPPLTISGVMGPGPYKWPKING